VERRLHPRHDREWLGRMAVLIVVLALSAGLAGVQAWLGRSSPWGVVPGLLVFLGLALIWGPRINSCPCPSCGQQLRRPPDTTDFVCEGCRVVWWTRGFGSYWRD
jgi:hypothetical protein